MNLIISKWMLVLENIYLKRKTYVSSISKETYITYSHTSKIVMELSKAGYVKKEKKGRSVFVELTEEGINIGNHVSLILQLLRRNDLIKEDKNV